jgi:hypothetical protein
MVKAQHLLSFSFQTGREHAFEEADNSWSGLPRHYGVSVERVIQ